MKRYFTKYIRDAAKSKYEKGTSCEICGSSEELDFHHFYSLAELVDKWVRRKGLRVETAEEAMAHRMEFIEAHQKELYEDAVTLCHEHHMKLHSIYGKNPGLGTAKKQARWVEKQRNALVQ